jgi:hypothetical protein
MSENRKVTVPVGSIRSVMGPQHTAWRCRNVIGGEPNGVHLAKLLRLGGNGLLDEPTNESSVAPASGQAARHPVEATA